ncbi:hypothetical protein [uncultured Ruegeria sp.]|uniref:hypothetical protein n=1 Tax=uncultured Ruegeria sp. TaxID=259304 RepID=UPI00261B25C6|nr:hypothetical protein [uncultured Ruegeria sp.]
MKTYKIKNGSARAKAFKVHGGLEVVEPGKDATIENAAEISDQRIAEFKAQKVAVTEVKARSGGKSAEGKAD